jgi:cupin superfamily acireductone dioxygenase involved in methionine salvage
MTEKIKEPIISNEQVDTAIKDKALELSNGKFSVEQFDNFMDALNARCLDNSRDKIEHLMKQRDYANLGLCVMNAIVAKLEEWSYAEAAGLYNSTLGGGDYDYN